ncbi:hypothetical protein FRC10_003061 [Ceratobasidium sp. 414]|nr:hypothetical protein FRC10_003061 [Ceratobasidium sp. 414]
MPAVTSAELNVYSGDNALAKFTTLTCSRPYRSLNMLLGAREEGKVAKDTDTIIEYPSGDTITLLDILVRIMGLSVQKELAGRTRHLAIIS